VEEGSELLINAEQLKQLMEFIKNQKKLNKGKFKINYACAGFLGFDYEFEVRDYPYFCRTGINIASILYNGDIYVCPDVPRMPELIQGNIKKDNFCEVWENKFEFFRNKNKFKNEKCEGCLNWDECLGGPTHLWDYKNCKPKKCHIEQLEK
jgi:radical SAM protein with 4Fe4S-binding SPASM domain